MSDDGQQSGARSDARDLRARRTAVLVAAIRASHLRWNRPPIFSDDYALQMTTPFWHLVATNRLLNRLIVHRLLKVFRPIHTENILRIRYAEDRLQEAVGPEELTAELARTGFSKLDRRYLQGRGDMPPPAANFAFALFGRD